MNEASTPDIGTGGQSPNLPGSVTPQSPANPVARRVTEANRRPMSLPQQKLQVPEIPGYYLYWHLETDIDAALQAGYEFVDRDEVYLNNSGVANDQSEDGNDDLGSRVSRTAGGLIQGTAQIQRHVLMKLRQEWRDNDLAALAKRHESIAASIRGGAVTNTHGARPDETPQDQGRKYLKAGQDLFYPKTRRT